MAWRQGLPLTAVAAAVAVLPIVVAAVRAIAGDWVPVGDNALISIRSADILSTHPPLVGSWSSASVSLGEDLNNPGPLLFAILAIPTRLFGVAGIAVGVAILNSLAVVGTAVFAHRRGGPLLGTAAAAMAAALSWTMGSELLYEPWQPHSLVLPALCFLVLVWSVACADLIALPLTVGVGSLLLQSHLSYAFLVPALATWAVVGLVLGLRRRRRADPSTWPRVAGQARAAGVAGAVILVLAWLPPLAQQLFGSGEGNLGHLATSAGGDAETLGFGFGARLMSSVWSLPPWWFRPSFRQVWLPAGSTDLGQADLPSGAAAAASLLLLGLAIAGCLWLALRRRDVVASGAVITGVVAALAGLMTAGQTPISYFGIPSHQFRWLWPVAAFLTFTLALSVVRRWSWPAGRAAPLAFAFLGGTVLFGAINLPTSDQGISAPAWSIAPSKDLYDQLADLDVEGTLFFDLGTIGFADPYSGAVMAALQRSGTPFVVESDWVSQLGPARRFTGDNAEAALLQRVGSSALEVRPGEDRLALHRSLDGDEQAELDGLVGQISSYITSGQLRLNRDGQVAMAEGEFPSLEDQFGRAGADPDAFFGYGLLFQLVRRDLIDLDRGWEPRFERYVDLKERLDRETVGVFLAPLDNDA